MRMDDCLPAANADAHDGPGASPSRPRSNGLRFTSNVVGSLYLVTDILCFIFAAPITLLNGTSNDATPFAT